MAAPLPYKYADINFYWSNIKTNRKNLFKEALSNAKYGKVLYITKEELTELPELPEDITSVSRQYMKMISFLYAKTLTSLIESISNFPEWQNIPSAIILENLTDYCPKENLQNACGILALLIDSARSCSISSGLECKIVVSLNEETSHEYEYCSLLKELYQCLL